MDPFEKRQSQRYACILDVDNVGKEPPPSSDLLRVLDISADGLRLRHASPLAVDAVLHVRIYNMDKKSVGPLQVRVVRCTQEGDSWESGVSFVKPISEDEVAFLFS